MTKFTLKHLKTGSVALLAAVATFGLVSALPSIASARTLNIATVGSANDEDTDAMMVFKTYIEARTDIKVEIFTDGSYCGSMRECLESVQAGTLESTVTTGGGFSTLFPPAQVFDVPYMMRDDRVAECVFGGPFFQKVRKALLEETDGIRLMVAANSGGWRNFATTTKQIKTPEDVQGVKFRTIPSPIQQQMVSSLGGNPTPVAWPEVYTALASGVVEGTKNGLVDVVNMNFQDYVKFVTLDGHTYVAGFWFINEDFWNGLSKAEKHVVNDAYYHLRTVGLGVPKRRNVDAVSTLEAAGVTVYVPTPEEKKAFQNATLSVQDWFAQENGEEWLNGMREAVATCEASIDAEIE